MQLSRRDLLASLLSLPVALSACKRSSRVPDGEIAFSPEVMGHRVRDGIDANIPEQPSLSKNIVIVGAGVAGLAAAWRLTRAGLTEYTIFELSDRIGGTSRSGSFLGGRFAPWGAHYITLPMAHNRALVALLSDMGALDGTDANGEPIAREEQLCRDPEERVFFEGEWHEGLLPHEDDPQKNREVDRFLAEVGKLAGLVDAKGRRAFVLPRAYASDDAAFTALDRKTFADWLDEHGFHDPRVRWLCAYACKDDYGTRPEETSAWAGLFYFAARKRTPSSPMQPVLTWPQGNARLVDHLFGGVRGKLATETAVYSITPRPEKNDALVATVNATHERVAFSAAHVIFAAPQMVARSVVTPLRRAAPPYLARFEYSPWMVANLSLDSRPRQVGFPLAWDSVLWDSPSLGYVNASHQTGKDWGPTILTYYRPLIEESPAIARKKLLAAGRDEWADVTLADLETAHPDIRALCTRLDIVRWGHAMVRPLPGLFADGSLAKAQAPLDNVHFANTDLSGLALFEEAFFHGIRAAEEVLRARGSDSPSLI